MRSSKEQELRRQLTDAGDRMDVDPQFERSLHVYIDSWVPAATTRKPTGEVDLPGKARRHTVTRLVPLAVIAAAVVAITTTAVVVGQNSAPGRAAVAPTTSTTVAQAGPVKTVTSVTGQGSNGGQTTLDNARTLEIVVGRVIRSDGKGLGGAVVTVSGEGPSTMTLTSGDIGAFQLAGLAVPGTYTLTVTMTGYKDRTETVALATGAPPTLVQITLDPLTRAPTGR